ncbi:MAG: sterol desaturase, partial [Erythrobacteraceae bacterium]|nr:sterol desaturase [Erythrobacteraceae bacterium]
MLGAIILSVLAMTAIVAVRYLAASGLFAFVTNRVRPGYH